MNDRLQIALAQGLARVPSALRAATEQRLDAITPHLPADTDSRLLEVLPGVAAVSEFVSRAFALHPELLADLIQSGDLLRSYANEIPGRLAKTLTGVADEADLKARVRLFRRREAVRVAFRDVAGLSDLHEVVATMSALADACLAESYNYLSTWAKEKLGVPIGESTGQEATFVVLGLGKLGGRELNFSSDVDLIFAYTEEGEIKGARALSNHEYFRRLGQSLINALAEPTGEGFAFRVDMRLRPNGASGPLVLGFDAFEQYYQTHGRDWERYAFIKARVVAGDIAEGEALLGRLKPFVFRKYLDYGAFEAIRSMKSMIEREMARKGMHEHVKLGPGGIREIEFIGQALQLLRAGREPPLQCRPILEALAQLGARGYLPANAHEELSAAYVFLRNVEHRLQMIGDEQTHVLPRDADNRLRVAFSMGFADWAAFEQALAQHRERVRHHFHQTFVFPGVEAGADEADELSAVWTGTTTPEAATRALASVGFSDAQSALDVLTGFRESAACRALSSEGRSRLDRLMPLSIKAAGATAEPETTLARLVNLYEAIGRRTTYFAMLVENRMALTQLVKLVAASPWIANWIAKHPIVLDELLDPRSLYEPLTQAALTAELRARMEALPEDDLELQMEVLREFRHSHVLRVAAADIGPGLPPERVGAHLACIVEVVLDECLRIAWRILKSRHGLPTFPGRSERPGFAIIGYGKLGSVEIGYASDLDMIFLYEGAHDGMTDGARSISNEEFFARLGQRVIHVLTTRTPGGILYQVDMRLRPSGQSGALVTSLSAFHDYQKKSAWTWEHQALVRARPVAGSPAVAKAFAEIRQEILCQPRDEATLKREVAEMRAKMAAANPTEDGEFNLKHSRGGIVDIEFMVQYWVLRWAHAHPVLTRHTDNINILDTLAAEQRLAPERAALLADAYRGYLSMEHRLKLAEAGSITDAAELGDLPQRIAEVWDETFNA